MAAMTKSGEAGALKWPPPLPEMFDLGAFAVRAEALPADVGAPPKSKKLRTGREVLVGEIEREEPVLDAPTACELLGQPSDFRPLLLDAIGRERREV